MATQPKVRRVLGDLTNTPNVVASRSPPPPIIDFYGEDQENEQPWVVIDEAEAPLPALTPELVDAVIPPQPNQNFQEQRLRDAVTMARIWRDAALRAHRDAENDLLEIEIEGRVVQHTRRSPNRTFDCNT